MCIILLDNRGAGKVLERDFIERCAEKNNDGLGIMYATGGKLYAWRSMDDLDGLYKRYVSARERALVTAVHFRASTITKGTVKIENTHPMLVHPKLAIMHNGTIEQLKPLLEDGMSDTRLFVDGFLKKLPENFMQDPVIVSVIKDFLVFGRAVLMDAHGKYMILNEYVNVAEWIRGVRSNGVWMSQIKDFRYIDTGREFIAPKTTTHKDTRSASLHPLGPGGFASSARKPLFRGAFSRKAKRRLCNKSSVTQNIIFEYGSFRDDMLGPKMLSSNLEFIGTGVLHSATLWECVQGKPSDPERVPGIKFHGPEYQAEIHGCLYRIPDKLAPTLEHIDAVMGFEGADKGMTTRVFKEVELVGVDRACSAYIYTPTEGLARYERLVPSGDWKEWCDTHKTTPPKLPKSKPVVEVTVQPTSSAVKRITGAVTGHQSGGVCPVCRGFDTEYLHTARSSWCYDCGRQFGVGRSCIWLGGD